LCTLAILAACSGGSQTALSSLPPAGSVQPSGQTPRLRFLPNGLVKGAAAGPSQVFSQLALPQTAKVGGRDLFVSTYPEIVELKNKGYKPAGTIVNGISDPDGVWLDQKGNLYVANAQYKTNAADVVEFAKGKSVPTCTYSSQLVDPINETTDAAGNVYVVDFNDGQGTGYVYEYAQCSNIVLASYSVSSEPEGIAVDAKNDLFVSYCGTTCGNFEEFKKGSITPTQLGATVTAAGGLIIDKKNDLFSVDQDLGRVDIIEPPYSTASPVISGLSYPFHLSFGEKGKLLFIANPGSNSVSVYKVPSYQLVTTLGSEKGFTTPMGVADSPNLVY
jgi:hypothetical protein